MTAALRRVRAALGRLLAITWDSPRADLEEAVELLSREIDDATDEQVVPWGLISAERAIRNAGTDLDAIHRTARDAARCLDMARAS